MSKFETTRKRYHIFKNDLRMGLLAETRADAFAMVEHNTLESYPELNTFIMYIGINRRYMRHYTIVRIINNENVTLVTYKIVPETIHIKMTDALEADFKKNTEE